MTKICVVVIKTQELLYKYKINFNIVKQLY